MSDLLANMKGYLTSIIKNSSYQIWASIDSANFNVIFSSSSCSSLTYTTPTSLHNDSDSFQKHTAYEEFEEIYLSFPNRYAFVVRIFAKHDWTPPQIKQLSATFSPYMLQKKLERHEHILNVLMKSIKEISLLQDSDYLLTRILENALSVISVADMGVLWMFDSSTQFLLPRAWSGGPNNEIQNMKMKVGEGIIGKTFQHNKSYMYTNLKDILRDSSTMTDDNIHYLNQSYTFTNIQSIISVPICMEEQTVCVLIIYQNGTTPLLNDEDKELLESFSDQVSIALLNSALFEDVKKQNELLIRRDQIHRTFMNVSLQSKGIEPILTELRRMVTSPVTIVDFVDNKTYGFLKFFDIDTKTAEFHTHFLSHTKPCFYTIEANNEAHSVYIHPIHGIDTLLGLLIMQANQGDLSSLDQVALEQSSSVIALEMLKKQTLVDLFYKRTHELFSEYLSCYDTTLLYQKAAELNIDTKKHILVALITIRSQADLQLLNLHLHRLVSDIKSVFSSKAPVVYGFDTKVTIVFTLDPHEEHRAIIKQLEDLLSKWRYYNECHIKIGIGSRYSHFTQIGKSYSEAEKAISYLLSQQQDGCILYEEIGINRLFINQSKEEVKTFIDEVFLPLKNNHLNDEPLEQTLEAYFDNNRSASLTAKQLHIHVNTLYQRLKKIEEKMNISFTNSEHLLKVQLACYLKKFHYS